jgi:hypothetical protein
MSLRLVLS